MNIGNVFNKFLDERKKYIAEVKKIDNKIERVKKRIPNILTASRMFAPLFIIPGTLLFGYTVGLVLAISFALTDAFDGYLARKWNATSEYGKVLDTVSDKLFAVGVAIPILITNPNLVLPIMALEGVIAGISCNSATKDNNPHSTYLGKTKTAILSISLAAIYFCKGLGIDLSSIYGLLATTNAFQMATATQYYHLDKKEQERKDKMKLFETFIEKDEKALNEDKEKTIAQEIRDLKNLRNALKPEENINEKDEIQKQKTIRM